MQNKVVLLTGASSGIGKETANLLKDNGFRVYGTSRTAKPELFDGKSGGFFQIVNLDVLFQESIDICINEILKKEKSIDVLINCAGIGIAGAMEDISIVELQTQLDVNLFGTIRMCQAVLPYMRNQKYGKIINIGSVAGFVTIPFQCAYSISKYSIDSFTQGLRMETAKYNIDVTNIAPGDTKTGFTDARIFCEKSEESIYYKDMKKAVNVMEKDEQNGMPASAVTKVILKCINKDKNKIINVVGFKYKFFYFLNKILPIGLKEYLIKRTYLKN